MNIRKIISMENILINILGYYEILNNSNKDLQAKCKIISIVLKFSRVNKKTVDFNLVTAGYFLRYVLGEK